MIRWPDQYRPGAKPIHVREELDIPGSPEQVWSLLVRAAAWPESYPAVKEVTIEGGRSELVQGSRFRWKIAGVPLDSVVEEFIPPERLAWSVRSLGIDAYHAWLIERLPSDCRVISEETQSGWTARLNQFLRPDSVAMIHRAWLESLRDAEIAWNTSPSEPRARPSRSEPSS